MKTEESPYSSLKRSGNVLHNISNEDLKKFISLAKLKSGMRVLDAMAGRSELMQELSKITKDIYIR